MSVLKKSFIKPVFIMYEFEISEVIQVSEVAPISLKTEISGVTAQSYGEQDISIFN